MFKTFCGLQSVETVVDYFFLLDENFGMKLTRKRSKNTHGFKSRIHTATWLNLVMLAEFKAQDNFHYCPSYLKKMTLASKVIISDVKIIS